MTAESKDSYLASERAQEITAAEAKQHALRGFSRSLPMNILRAREAVMGLFRPILNNYNLTEQQWRVMRFLYENNAVRPSEISFHTKIHTTSLSRIIGILRKKALIERVEVESDLRSASISITPQGRVLVEEVGPELELIYEHIEQIITHDDFQLLNELILKIERELRC